MNNKSFGTAIFVLLFSLPLLALAQAFLTAGMLFLPLMISLHFLNSFAPAIPALGWQASFWLLVVARLVFPGAGYGTSGSSKD